MIPRFVLPDDSAHSHYCDSCGEEYLCEAQLIARVNDDATCGETCPQCPACVKAAADEFEALSGPDGFR